MQSPDFWKNREKANKLSKELNDLKEELKNWEELEGELERYLSLEDKKLAEVGSEVEEFERKFRAIYNKTFLSGKYDKNTFGWYQFKH